MSSIDAGARHREHAARFAAVVDHVRDWEAPAPVAGWTALSVVDHLTTWFPAFVHAGSPYGWTQRTSAIQAPALAWAEQSDAVQLILDDPAQAGSTFHHPQVPACTLGEAVDRFYTPDVFMHSWDLARASGQETELDAEYAEELLAGMESMEEMIRSSGQYGARVPVPDSSGAGTSAGLHRTGPALVPLTALPPPSWRAEHCARTLCPKPVPEHCVRALCRRTVPEPCARAAAARASCGSGGSGCRPPLAWFTASDPFHPGAADVPA